ncbi:Polyamine oxidase 5 [Hibiscus syriacus]|uniref:Polyamine oxidase 5 n=1 Tax=Hibiscus syriacus TaxID=106335 RepID=A0A6A3CFT2_HIBSY|nr:uncharacterized protein LOC120201290 [Hibiscus syriacus]KAE8726228.1 Polyamine oxidase 5 [Hibiscus syriacus]
MEETGEESPALKRKREAGTTELNDESSECETESMSELLKLLDDSAEATVSASSYTSSPTSYGTRVKFSDNPYSTALIFQSSSSYITINGNEESCGSSFSESESSVMASVDMGGILNANAKAGSGLDGIREWLEAEEDGGAYEEEVRGSMLDSQWEWDEEQLAKFLGEECP